MYNYSTMYSMYYPVYDNGSCDNTCGCYYDKGMSKDVSQMALQAPIVSPPPVSPATPPKPVTPPPKPISPPVTPKLPLIDPKKLRIDLGKLPKKPTKSRPVPPDRPPIPLPVPPKPTVPPLIDPKKLKTELDKIPKPIPSPSDEDKDRNLYYRCVQKGKHCMRSRNPNDYISLEACNRECAELPDSTYYQCNRNIGMCEELPHGEKSQFTDLGTCNAYCVRGNGNGNGNGNGDNTGDNTGNNGGNNGENGNGDEGLNMFNILLYIVITVIFIAIIGIIIFILVNRKSKERYMVN